MECNWRSFQKTYGFVDHQISSFNEFLMNGIPKIINEEPDIIINPETVSNKRFKSYKVSFSDVYIPKPNVIEDNRELRSFAPHEARLRDLTYDSPIYVNIKETFEIEGEKTEVKNHIRHIIGRIPIMLRSNNCHLTYMTPEERIKKGECKYDEGGYFIIKGKERVLVSQIRGIYNTVLILKQGKGDKYDYIAEIRSMSEETGHSVLIQSMFNHLEKHFYFSITICQRFYSCVYCFYSTWF